MKKQRVMELKQIFSQTMHFILKMVSSPRAFWEEVIERKATIHIFSHFYLPLLVVVVLAGIVGEFLSNPEALLSYSLEQGFKQAVVFLLYFPISAYIVNSLSTIFGGNENLTLAQMAIGFSMAPVLVVSIITGLFPFLYPLGILGLYGIYVFYRGVPYLFGISGRHMIFFTVSAIVVNFITFAVLSIIFWKLFDFIF